jgi:Ca-activated chloride channel family protein
VPPEFHFLRPLWLLMLIPLMGLLWALARQSGTLGVWQKVVDAHLLPHLLVDAGGRAGRAPLILLALGWLVGAVALAGPVWERLPQPVYQAQAQRVIALDISPTMNATDVPPSRLARARFEVLDLLKRAAEGQTGLLAYGAEPYVVSPLTSDAATIAAQVPSLATSLLPVEGSRRTDLALEKGAELLRQAGSHDGEVILVTDGLDHPAVADEAAAKLRAEGYRVSVLGVGTHKGAPVPMADGGFLKDPSGAIRMSRLETDSLRTLVTAGGGRFVPATLGDSDVDTLIPQVRARAGGQVKQQDLRADEWREEGPWLLLLVLPLAALAFRRGWLSPLLLLVLLTPPPAVHAFEWQDLWLRPDQQAARALAYGKAEEAASRFERPDWRAAARYQAGDYKGALKSLDAVSGGEADYDKGNSLARLGRFKEALKAYDQALAADPKDDDARFNRDLVQKLLEQQKQQQKQNGQKQAQDGQKAGAQNQKGQAGRGSKAQDRSGQQARQGAHNGKQQGGEQRSGQEQAGGEKGAQQGQSAEKQGQSLRQPSPAVGAKGDKQQPRAPAQAAAAKPQEKGAEQGAKPKSPSRAQRGDREPGLSDLLGEQPKGQPGQAAGLQDPAEREQVQAMEQMLRRVPDDPGGLLRQRFLLQHLRRTGEMP